MRFRAALLTVLLTAACATHAPASDENAIPASYPEGPLWRGEQLYYAEMGADRISVWEQGQRRTFFQQEGCGPTALAPYGDGFLILCHIGARLVAVNANGDVERTWTADDRGVRLTDPNDGYEDGRGGVYFSDPGIFSRATLPHGRLMYLSADGALRAVAGPLWYPNGVYTDIAKRQLYVDEHMAGHVLRYDIQADGGVGDPTVFIDINRIHRPEHYDTPYAETGPDGLEMGPDGDFYVAIYGGGQILRFSSQGALLGEIALPTRYSTNIAFNAHGDAATTGSFENEDPPYPGEVRFHTAASLTHAGS